MMMMMRIVRRRRSTVKRSGWRNAQSRENARVPHAINLIPFGEMSSNGWVVSVLHTRAAHGINYSAHKVLYARSTCFICSRHAAHQTYIVYSLLYTVE